MSFQGAASSPASSARRAPANGGSLGASQRPGLSRFGQASQFGHVVPSEQTREVVAAVGPPRIPGAAHAAATVSEYVTQKTITHSIATRSADEGGRRMALLQGQTK
jgi:hypothetical protein